MNQPKGPSADFPETEPQPLEPPAPATPDLPLDVGPDDGADPKDRQAGGR